MSNPTQRPTYHWRRHEDTAEDSGTAWTATACGRLVAIDETKGDPSEADCSECGLIWELLKDWQEKTASRIVLDAFEEAAKQDGNHFRVRSQVTLYDSEPMKGGGPFTRAEMTCRKCGAVFAIINETSQAIHFATGLCKACIQLARPTP